MSAGMGFYPISWFNPFKNVISLGTWKRNGI
jgi:hypothetical protein